MLRGTVWLVLVIVVIVPIRIIVISVAIVAIVISFVTIAICVCVAIAICVPVVYVLHNLVGIVLGARILGACGFRSALHGKVRYRKMDLLRCHPRRRSSCCSHGLDRRGLKVEGMRNVCYKSYSTFGYGGRQCMGGKKRMHIYGAKEVAGPVALLVTVHDEALGLSAT